MQILYLAKLNNIDYLAIENVEKVHDAARFLIEAGQNFDLINKYAKRDLFSWCEEDYRKQCIDRPYGRIIGYGWIAPYKQLFPDHENISLLDLLANEMATSDDMAPDRQLALSAILKSAYPVEKIKKNLVSDRSQDIENYTTVYEDAHPFNRGSPHCLYTVTER